MRHFRTWLIAGLATLAALAFLQPSVRASVHELLYPFDNALLRLRRSVGTRVGAFLHRGGYAARIRSLEGSNAILKMESADCAQLEAENARLRALLDYPMKKFRGSWLPAPVLTGSGLFGQRPSLRIGKGSSHGVVLGAPVATPEGLVGRISEVSSHTAEVMLLTDPNCRVPVEISVGADPMGAVGIGSARGILGGGGARAVGEEELWLLYVVEPLRVRYLERDFEPPVRAKVMTSGAGQVFPRGMTVGWLLESRVDADGLSREAEVAPAVDFASLSDVFVLRSSKGGASE